MKFKNPFKTIKNSEKLLAIKTKYGYLANSFFIPAPRVSEDDISNKERTIQTADIHRSPLDGRIPPIRNAFSA